MVHKMKVKSFKFAFRKQDDIVVLLDERLNVFECYPYDVSVWLMFQIICRIALQKNIGPSSFQEKLKWDLCVVNLTLKPNESSLTGRKRHLEGPLL